jgi:hypothetical protein
MNVSGKDLKQRTFYPSKDAIPSHLISKELEPKGKTVESERGQSKVTSSRKWLQRESQRRAQGGNVVKKGFAMRKGSFSNIESFEYCKDRKSDRAR